MPAIFSKKICDGQDELVSEAFDGGRHSHDTMFFMGPMGGRV